MKVDVDYKFRDDLFKAKEDGSTCPIEILVDFYAGVVYRYTTVTFKMDDDGVPHLQFSYELLETKKFSELKLRQDSRFIQMVGLILNALMLEASEEDGESETRTDDNQEPHKE
jgi:hypothetical protein